MLNGRIHSVPNLGSSVCRQVGERGTMRNPEISSIMLLRNSNTRWGAVSQFLHWLILVLSVVMAVLGLSMTELPNGIDKIKTYALHKSIGISVLALVLWRLENGRATGRDRVCQ